MDKKIVFKIDNNKLTIYEEKRSNSKNENLNNTNVINIDNLAFSTDYMFTNLDLVAGFLNVVILKSKVKAVEIEKTAYYLLIMDVINQWDQITKITFKENKKINIDLFMKLLDNKKVKEINCYEMDSFLLDRITLNNNVKVKTRNKIQFKSEFIKDNALKSYSDLFYKKMIAINHDFNETEIEDFKTFIAINTKLRQIKILHYNNYLIDEIIKILKEYNRMNILIEINEKKNDLDEIYNSINQIKKQYKQYLEKNDIKFKLNYSKEYKYQNFLKQINFKIVKYILLIIIGLSGFTLLTIDYKHYKDGLKIDDELKEINTLIDDSIFNEQDITVEEENPEGGYVEPEETPNKKPGYVSPYYKTYSKSFDKLLEINKDTVGWLKVNNTKINYPVVQGKDNKYYLKRAFDGKKNSLGWVFVDKRNHLEDDKFDDNTIIYGHNIKSGIMFGQLKNILEEKWYKNEKNYIVTFNTPTKKNQWKVFSVYKIPKTTDYLLTNFSTKKDKLAFIEMITKRSLYDFKVKVDENSKILTLSTCNNHVDRTVLHAVLIEE